MSFSPLHIWASMGPLSKAIALFILLMAMVTIAIVVERFLAMARGATATRKFVALVGDHLDGRRFAKVADIATEHPASPFARIVGPTVRKLARGSDGELSAVELARRESERQKEAVSADLRRGMSVIASVGSITPFVGLLGTVVGIITAFQGIASSGSGGLGSVSAGISEALIETALGLLVAIPAVLFFNALSARIAGVESQLARATGELMDELENAHGHRSSGNFQVNAAE
jgi:biopolymer transport protein ExbB